MSSSTHQTPPEPRVPCHHNEREGRSSLPPADWVNQVSTTDTGAQSRFEFFYHVIFTFVHSALTLLMTPVLKMKNTRPRRRRGRSSGQRSRANNPQQQQREPRSFGEVDPELAMPSRSVVENIRTKAASSSSSSSILKSQRRRSGDQPQAGSAGGNTATAAKSVRFPEPRRSRPPLGRISSSTISGPSSSASVGEASSSSSSSASSSSRNGRGRMAHRYTPRTHHTTYFLSDY